MFKRIKSLFVSPLKQVRNAVISELSRSGVYDLSGFAEDISEDELVRIVDELRIRGTIEGEWYNKSKLRFMVYSKAKLSFLLKELESSSHALEQAAAALDLAGFDEETSQLLKRKKMLVHENLVMHHRWIADQVGQHLAYIDVDERSLEELSELRTSAEGLMESLISFFPALTELSADLGIPAPLVEEGLSRLGEEQAEVPAVLSANGLVVPRKQVTAVMRPLIANLDETDIDIPLTELAIVTGFPLGLIESAVLQLVNDGQLPDFQILASDGVLRRRAL